MSTAPASVSRTTSGLGIFNRGCQAGLGGLVIWGSQLLVTAVDKTIQETSSGNATL